MDKAIQELNEARTAGRVAGEAGEPLEANPYIRPTTTREGCLCKAWEVAWLKTHGRGSSQHQADAYDADQDAETEQSEAYRDSYEAWTGPGDEQDNPYSGRCTSTGDEAACESAADWDAGHAASQADYHYHEQGQA